MRHVWYSVALVALLGAAGLAQDAPKKISRATALSIVETKVQPEYPQMARQLKIQGAVELEAQVSEAGEVTKVDIVSGNPVLTAPSVQALKKWKFRPLQEDGKPIRFVAPILLDFKL